MLSKAFFKTCALHLELLTYLKDFIRPNVKFKYMSIRKLLHIFALQGSLQSLDYIPHQTYGDSVSYN